MKVRLALMAATLFLGSGQAMAAPVTFGFSGTLVSMYPGSPANGQYNGKAFSGTLSFDVAGQSPIYQNYGSGARYDVWSENGCTRFMNGACISGPVSPATPLMTGASISGDFGSYILAVDESGGGTSSVISRETWAGSGYSGASYVMYNDTGYETTSPNGLRMERVVRSAGLSLATNWAPLFTDFHNLSEVPSLRIESAVERAFRFEQYTSVRECIDLPERTCTDSRQPGNFEFYGRIAEIHLVEKEAPADVPEPASLAMLGLGLAALGAARRRKG